MLTGTGMGGVFLLVFLVNAALALIPAAIAASKGRSGFGYWVFGLFFFVIALIVALVVSDESRPRDAAVTRPTRVQCPRCAELVAAGAMACRFCGMEYDRPLMPPMTVARACPTDGCSERGRPTDRRHCDVCEAATYPLTSNADSTS